MPRMRDSRFNNDRNAVGVCKAAACALRAMLFVMSHAPKFGIGGFGSVGRQ